MAGRRRRSADGAGPGAVSAGGRAMTQAMGDSRRNCKTCVFSTEEHDPDKPLTYMHCMRDGATANEVAALALWSRLNRDTEGYPHVYSGDCPGWREPMPEHPARDVRHGDPSNHNRRIPPERVCVLLRWAAAREGER